MRSRDRFTTLLVAATAVAVLAGCTGGSGDGRSRDVEPSSDTSRSRPTPTGPMPTASPAGSHVLGLKWNWSQHATLDYVASVGGGATFTEVEWCAVEPVEGSRDWTRVDSIVQRSEQLGHEVMLKIRTGRCWATQPPEPGARDTSEAVMKTPSTAPRDVAVYEEFVTDLVTRYAEQGVHTYAVENEPDVYNFWAGPVADYEELVRVAAPVIRAADPEAKILDAGMSSTGYGVVLAQALLDAGDSDAAVEAYQRYYERRIEGGASRWPAVFDRAALEAILGSAPALRATEIMDATTRLVQDGVVDAYQLHFYEPTSELPGLLEMIRERVGDADIEAWEVGIAWPGDGYDAEDAAAETTRLIATLLADGITRIVYLPLAYTPGNTPQVFRGLIDESGTLLPAGEAFEYLTDLLVARSRRTFEPVATDDPGLQGVIVDRADSGQVAVVWSTGAETTLRLEDGESATDLRGEPLSGEPVVGTDPVVVVSSGDTLAERLGAAG